jgi:hypothetical protein
VDNIASMPLTSVRQRGHFSYTWVLDSRKTMLIKPYNLEICTADPLGSCWFILITKLAANWNGENICNQVLLKLLCLLRKVQESYSLLLSALWRLGLILEASLQSTALPFQDGISPLTGTVAESDKLFLDASRKFQGRVQKKNSTKWSCSKKHYSKIETLTDLTR